MLIKPHKAPVYVRHPERDSAAVKPAPTDSRRRVSLLPYSKEPTTGDSADLTNKEDVAG
jgi:hypothetical protein